MLDQMAVRPNGLDDMQLRTGYEDQMVLDQWQITSGRSSDRVCDMMALFSIRIAKISRVVFSQIMGCHTGCH